MAPLARSIFPILWCRALQFISWRPNVDLHGNADTTRGQTEKTQAYLRLEAILQVAGFNTASIAEALSSIAAALQQIRHWQYLLTRALISAKETPSGLAD